jgi:DNA-binding winged helix-turn-helix (wHTH) protein/tetratricopeptide (TPR) repeat protein/TolB-like protein
MATQDGQARGTGPARRTGGDAPSTGTLAFGEFRIDCTRRRLLRNGRRIRIQQKPLDVLIYLTRNQDRVVTRHELLEQFWFRTVNEEALTRCISTLRKLLGDTREPARFIETVWGRGYHFIEPVRISNADPPAADDPLLPGAGSDMPAGTSRPGDTRLWTWGLAAIVAGLAMALAGAWLRETPDDTADISIRRLAVLPMDAGHDADRWLAEALTDHLTHTIAQIEGVTVIARGATAHLSSHSDPRTLGQQLGVEAVLTSQLVRNGEQMGLRSQLLSTADGSVLWSFTAPPSVGGPVPAQSEQLATAVAKRLWATLRIREQAAAVAPEAYRHYLQGRYYWNQRSPTGLAAAIEAYEAALAIEPEYVDALVGLADSWLLVPLYSATPPAYAAHRARAAAERALQLDRRASGAHAVLGVIAMQYDWDWAEAEASLHRALTLNPNNAAAEQWLAEMYCYRFRPDDCRQHLRTATSLDPLSPVLRMLRGSPALFSGDFPSAVTTYLRALEDDPDFAFTRYVLGLAYTGLGEWDRAIAAYRASLPHLGMAIVGGPLVFAMARGGDTDGARRLVAELEDLALRRYVPPTKLATAWLGLAERERALHWLERALEVRDDRLVYLGVDVHFLELHDDPGFRSYAERVGVLDILRPL